jgi:hypothetical protein
MTRRAKAAARQIPDEVLFPEHEDPCLRCRLVESVNEFHAAGGLDTVDPDMVIDTLGDCLAQWIASLDDPRYRNFTADIAGEILKLRVKHYRETGRYPCGPGHSGGVIH